MNRLIIEQEKLTLRKKYKKKYDHQYYLDNKEKIAKRAKEWDKENSEKRRETKRRYYTKHAKRILKQRKDWNQKNPEKRRKYQIKYLYGLSAKDYNQLFIKQKGHCAICDKHQNELIKRLSFDHNHKTNKIRGLLCARCNMAIGLFDENIIKMLTAVQYLRKWKKI